MQYGEVEDGSADSSRDLLSRLFLSSYSNICSITMLQYTIINHRTRRADSYATINKLQKMATHFVSKSPLHSESDIRYLRFSHCFNIFKINIIYVVKDYTVRFSSRDICNIFCACHSANISVCNIFIKRSN